jgi:DNA-directed RNA polymerase specialized sigma24 family protein
VLCDIEGLSYEEIAATLDVKLGTVRSRIHRGRALLRSELAHRRPTGFGDTESVAEPTTSSEEITR